MQHWTKCNKQRWVRRLYHMKRKWVIVRLCSGKRRKEWEKSIVHVKNCNSYFHIPCSILCSFVPFLLLSFYHLSIIPCLPFPTLTTYHSIPCDCYNFSHVLYLFPTFSFIFLSIASLWLASFHMILSLDSFLFTILCSMLHISRYINSVEYLVIP